MIPRDHITEWRARAPWVPDVQVEQDLIISRALIGIFSHPVLSDGVPWKGEGSRRIPPERNPGTKAPVAAPQTRRMRIISTKLRALYQRKKGRDLFDIRPWRPARIGSRISEPGVRRAGLHRRKGRHGPDVRNAAT